MSGLKLPFVNLRSTIARVEERVLPIWTECLRKADFIGGAYVKKFEFELARKLGVKFAVSCANGTDAIQLALQASGIGAGMKVALPNLTFWASYEAIVQVGAIPIIIDIDPLDQQMSFEEFREAYNKYGFEAGILVHLFGWASSRLSEFREFCGKNGIRLIEDGAQSVGTTCDLGGGLHGIFAEAEIATLSFYPAKVVGGCMDGGAVVSKLQEVADKVRVLANHGRTTHYGHSHVGWNSRMGVLQAVYLYEVLQELDGIIDARQAALAHYREILRGVPGIEVKAAPRGISENGYLLVLNLLEKDPVEIERRLVQEGIGCARTYPQTVASQLPAKNALRCSDLQHSTQFCTRVLNLPLFDGITNSQCELAAEALRGVCEESN